MVSLGGFLQAVLPKKKAIPGGSSYTDTFRPYATDFYLPLPTYKEFQEDIFHSRSNEDSRDLLRQQFQQDPDVSAAVSAYLTVADVEPWWVVTDATGAVNRDGHKILNQLILALCNRHDYNQPQPFAFTKSLRSLCEEIRYLMLLRGGCGSELVLDRIRMPVEIRLVDLATLYWIEEKPAMYTPLQRPRQVAEFIDLNIPTFMVSYYHRDPTNIYSQSTFVASINTIASRQQVINDLYRIMRRTGYPRFAIKVVEDVMRKNAPVNIQNDEDKMKTWMRARFVELQNLFLDMSPDQALVHWDSAELRMVNEKAPGMSMDITGVIETLNAQNQAALKVMATVIGRGNGAAGTASVEARIFALSAQQLNAPVADLLSQIFTLALRLQGLDLYATFGFDKVELRPEMELEPQKIMRQSRLLELLSLGLIDDDEFHLKMFKKIRPDDVPKLQGTGFQLMNKIDTNKTSPNNDPLGQSLTPDDSASHRSNGNEPKPLAPKKNEPKGVPVPNMDKIIYPEDKSA